MNDLILSMRDVSVSFRTDFGIVYALNGVNLDVKRGEVHCIIGESGCGKSVTARTIMRILGPQSDIKSGSVKFFDRQQQYELTDGDEDSKQMLYLRGEKIAMIFQEPMSAFSAVHTVGSQITEIMKLHHPQTTQADRQERAVELLRRVGMPQPEAVLKKYTYELSGGMRQRAMIAMALMNNPDLLIADEPTTALDVTIQAQILELLLSLRQEFEMSMILITHDMGVVAETAETVSVMYLGRVVESADVKSIFEQPAHPYTRKLIDAIPTISRNRTSFLEEITGTVPDASMIPAGCPFHPRCPKFIESLCDREIPRPIQMTKKHLVNCHLVDEEKQL